MYRKLSNNALLAFITSFSAGFAATGELFKADAEVSAIEAEVVADKELLETAIATQVQKQAESRSATEVVNNLRQKIVNNLARLQTYAKAKELDEATMALLGFDSGTAGRSSVVSQPPTEVSATGYSNGVNSLRWNRNGNGYGVNFIVEAKIGNNDFQIVGTTRRSSFNHSGQTPGVTVMYRVKAQSASGSSEYSDVAVIYG